MDLKGSLIDTCLRIYPSDNLTTFLKSLPDDEDFPINILKIIGKNSKGNLNEDVAQPSKVHLTDQDSKHIKSISDYVKANTVPLEAVEKPAVSNTDDKQKQNHNEKEKSGDTPEKHVKDTETDTMKSKKKKSSDTKEDKKNLPDEEDCGEKQDAKDSTEEEIPEKNLGPFLVTTDIDWLYFYMQKRRSKGDDIPYLHTLIEGARVELPENKIITRNAELEARCVKLRSQADARAYRKMTKGVDNVRMRFPEDSISYQSKLHFVFVEKYYTFFHIL